MGGSTLEEKSLPVKDAWHNWHKPAKASGTEAVAVIQQQVQQHPLCPVASVLVAEPHPAELKQLVGLKGAIITAVVTEEALVHTIRGGAVVVAVFWDIMKDYCYVR